MSEETSGGDAPEGIVEEQTQGQAYSTDSSKYNSENSEEMIEGSQERQYSNKSVMSKAERLEKKLGSKLRKIFKEEDSQIYERNIEEVIQNRELTPEEIEGLEKELKETKYFPAGFNSVDGYIKAWKNQDKTRVKDGIKGLWYLVKGFIDVEAEEDRDVYEKIANMKNVPILYISGAFEYPMSISEIEKHSGYDIAHIKERKDPDKINDIIEYTIEVTGQKPIVIGFSDGGKSIENYIERYGLNKVSMFYAIAASKFDVENPNKVVFIDGKKDRLFILEKDTSKNTNAEVFKVDGGHTWTCYDPITIQQIFEIIERTARVEGRNFESFNKKAA